jgi:hypothetical protein
VNRGTEPVIFWVCIGLAAVCLVALVLLRSPKTRLSRWLESIDPGQDDQ